MKIRKHILAILVSFISIAAYSQVPTDQDCLGAIPVCPSYYYQPNTYVGTGNYPLEINSGISCLGSGEKNDVWYVFTVSQSGNVAFSITPNDMNDDYDWAVYNLTNNPCSDIYSNASLEVSCNYSGIRGITGPNGLGGGQNEPVIPVLAGETYVVNVSNYSSSNYGYALDFAASTADIFDDTPPTIDSIFQPISCGSFFLDFSFSERILCSSLSVADLSLVGPGGPYTLSNLTGAGCSAGGTSEKDYSVFVTPTLLTPGTYYLIFDATASGSITDICGNTATSNGISDSLMFVIPEMNITTTLISEDTCNLCQGQVQVDASNGTGPYSYEWSTNPAQTNPILSNLCGDSTYYVTITDDRYCSIIDSIYVPSTSIEISTNIESEDYCGDSVGKISLNLIGNTPPYTYHWSTNPVQTTDTAFNLVGNQWYYVTVTDGNGCIDFDSAYITVVDGPNISITNTNTSTSGVGGWASTNTNGGTTPYTYLWNSNPPQIGDSLLDVSGGTYTVTVTDVNGCSDTVSVHIDQIDMTITTEGTDEECSMSDGTVSVITYNAVGIAHYLWSTGDTTATLLDISAGTYSVTVTDTANSPQIANITIYNTPGPTALFSAVPWMKTNIDPTIQFINNSLGASSYLWDFGDGVGSTDAHPSHLYPVLPMIYNVTLYAYTNVGCEDSISKSVEIREELILYMPNAFTPNGDGLNEIAIPKLKDGTYVEGTYDFKIFNRWGELVFYTNDPLVGWDGNVKGKPAQNNTYIYTINVVEKGGINKEFTGKISILR